MQGRVLLREGERGGGGVLIVGVVTCFYSRNGMEGMLIQWNP